MGFGIGSLNTSLPAEIEAPTTTGHSPEQTLLAVLQKIGALQNQPLVPDNPLAQLGTALQGFAAGVAGKENPALAEYKADRALRVQTLQHQAAIAGTLATIENQRATRAHAERQLEEMVKERTAAREDRERSFDYNVAQKATESDNFDERVGGYARMQRIVSPTTRQPLIDPAADPRKLAMMRGKDFATKWDRAIDMVSLGVEPPVDEYPRDVFPVDTWKQTRATPGGMLTLEGMKRGTAPTEGALKVEYAKLSAVPAEQRTPAMTARMAAIEEGVNLSMRGQNTVLAMERALRKRDAAAGLPPKDDAEYLRLAVKETTRTESFEQDLDNEADRLHKAGTLRDAAAVFAWKDRKRTEYQRAIAEVKAGAQPLSAEWGGQIAVLRDTKAAVVTLLQEFTPQERAQFAGWFNYTKSQLNNALRGQDPLTADATVKRFARFKALLGRVQTYAFSLGGKQLTEGERDIVFLGIPTGKEISPTDFEVKLKEAYQSIDRITEDKITLATSPKDFIKRMPKIEMGGTKPTLLPDGSIDLTPGMAR